MRIVVQNIEHLLEISLLFFLFPGGDLFIYRLLVEMADIAEIEIINFIAVLNHP